MARCDDKFLRILNKLMPIPARDKGMVNFSAALCFVYIALYKANLPKNLHKTRARTFFTLRNGLYSFNCVHKSRLWESLWLKNVTRRCYCGVTSEFPLVSIPKGFRIRKAKLEWKCACASSNRESGGRFWIRIVVVSVRG